MIEEILKDNSKADTKFGVISLRLIFIKFVQNFFSINLLSFFYRYFNPIGAHESGLIGEGTLIF